MNLIFFEPSGIRGNLLPFTFTRPISAIRVGIRTLEEKWNAAFSTTGSYITQAYLQHKFKLRIANANLLINGAVCPNKELLLAIHALKDGQALVQEGTLLAGKCDASTLELVKEDSDELHDKFVGVNFTAPVTIIKNVWDIFTQNGAEIRHDFSELTADRVSSGVQDRYTIQYGEGNIFVEEGVTIKAAVLNAEAGPIYIGKNATIMEGAVIRGPFALGEGSSISMGARIRGDSSFGPYCKIGGEVSNSVVFGYSNKSHDGFMGNSVIGEWCNFGADTNISNLKNNYSDVKIWNYPQQKPITTGRQFCGLMMGDHTRCGINTMFNTGTVVGVGANIFGAGFRPKYIPSFSWSNGMEFDTYDLNKFFETAEVAMNRRGIELDAVERRLLTYLFDQSKGDKYPDK